MDSGVAENHKHDILCFWGREIMISRTSWLRRDWMIYSEIRVWAVFIFINQIYIRHVYSHFISWWFLTQLFKVKLKLTKYKVRMLGHIKYLLKNIMLWTSSMTILLMIIWIYLIMNLVFIGSKGKKSKNG